MASGAGQAATGERGDDSGKRVGVEGRIEEHDVEARPAGHQEVLRTSLDDRGPRPRTEFRRRDAQRRSDAAMAQMGVLQPDRFTDMMAPGFVRA
jgi:hypothetical protein